MHRLGSFVLGVIIAVFPTGEAFGGSVVILGDVGDGTVGGTVGQDQGLTAPMIRVGVAGNDVQGIASMFFFALPTVSSPSLITDAQLNLQYLGISQFTVTTVPNFNADLFGIGSRSTPTILGTDYYDGNAALSTDTLIAQGFITPTTAAGNLQVSGGNLLSFIKSLYNPDGTPTAAFAVLRVNPDMDLPAFSGPYRGYELATANNTDAGGAYVPELTLMVVPEPSTMGLAAIGAAILGCGGWRRLSRRAADRVRG